MAERSRVNSSTAAVMASGGNAGFNHSNATHEPGKRNNQFDRCNPTSSHHFYSLKDFPTDVFLRESMAGGKQLMDWFCAFSKPVVKCWRR